MKYFTAKIDGKDEILGSAGVTKRYLKTHPEIQSVVRWWWSGSDLIECDDYSREQILGATVKQSETGATAQWAVDHHAVYTCPKCDWPMPDCACPHKPEKVFRSQGDTKKLVESETVNFYSAY